VTCSMNVNLPVEVSMIAIAVAGPVPWKSPVKVSVLVMRATRVLPVLLRIVSCKSEAVAWPVTNVGFATQALAGRIMGTIIRSTKGKSSKNFMFLVFNFSPPVLDFGILFLF
jgi:uncharacterized membrane protein